MSLKDEIKAIVKECLDEMGYSPVAAPLEINIDPTVLPFPSEDYTGTPLPAPARCPHGSTWPCPKCGPTC